MSRYTIEVAVYSNRSEHLVRFPAKWEICQGCQGEATTSRHIECDGGGFTASEWAEQDDDFREDYLSGQFDRPCPECNGLGRVQTIDVSLVHGWRQRILLKAYFEQERDSRDIDAIQAAELRMGA